MIYIFLNNICIYEGILDSSKDDFEDGDEVYEAIGEVLHEVAEKTENEVRSVNVFKFLHFLYHHITLSYILIITLNFSFIDKLLINFLTWNNIISYNIFIF